MSGPEYALGRHLDAADRHDPRSRDYPAEQAQQLVTVQHAHHVAVLDQGQLGSCTGNAVALTEQDAVAIYSWATHHDRVQGVYPPQDTGSDGLSVAKAVKHLADGGDATVLLP